MNWIYIILSVIAFIILFVLFAGINISFLAEYKDKKFRYRLRVYVLNKALGKDIKFEQKPKTDDESPLEDEKNETQKDVSESGEDTEDSGKKSVKEFFSDLKKTVRKYLNYKDAFMMTATKLRKRFVFKTLELACDFGDGDARTTAIATGSIWGLLYNILAFITRISKVLKHKEMVNAKFNQKVFYVKAEGIFRVRLVHIIYALILMKINYNKILKRNNNEKKKGV